MRRMSLLQILSAVEIQMIRENLKMVVIMIHGKFKRECLQWQKDLKEVKIFQNLVFVTMELKMRV